MNEWFYERVQRELDTVAFFLVEERPCKVDYNRLVDEVLDRAVFSAPREVDFVTAGYTRKKLTDIIIELTDGIKYIVEIMLVRNDYKVINPGSRNPIFEYKGVGECSGRNW